jgi:ATP-dependent Clp protease protease subunit
MRQISSHCVFDTRTLQLVHAEQFFILPRHVAAGAATGLSAAWRAGLQGVACAPKKRLLEPVYQRLHEHKKVAAFLTILAILTSEPMPLDRLSNSRIFNDDDPDEDPDIPEPIGPETAEPDENKAFSTPVHELERRLFKQRVVLIFGAITDKLARDVTARLLALAGDADKPIDVWVNSPGGHVESGDTIHDMLRYVDGKSEVRMIGTGWVASAAAIIYLSVPKERRLCLPNTRFLLHQPLGGARGPASDIAIEAKEIVLVRERLNRQIAAATGQPYESVTKDTDRNFWMPAEKAKEYGMVSRIISSAAELG